MRNVNVEVEGAKLSVQQSEGTDGAPVFLCHGNSSSSASFAALLNGRVGRKHKLFAIDFPGHGASSDASDPATSYSIPKLGECVRAVIEHVGAMQYHLVGHSLGGHVLSEALANLRGAKSLMLVSAPPIDKATIGQIFKPDPTGGVLFKGELDERDALSLANFLADRERVTEDVFATLKAAILRTDARFRPSLGASLGRGDFGGEAEAIAKSTLPVAVCFGKKDAFLNNDCYASIRFPNLWRNRFCEFEETGHSPHLEATERFETLLLDFLAETAG